MEFCPKCKVLMFPKGDIFICNTCGAKKKKREVLLLWRNKNRKKQSSLKRRLIFFRKHGLSARNVGIMKRFGFFDRRGRVMNRKQGFLRVQNVNIAGGNIKDMFSL